MKYVLSALIALGCVSANATYIIKVKGNQIPAPLTIGEQYASNLLVGRLSAWTWQVELTGMLVSDVNAVPVRTVKATLDISMDAGNGEVDDTQAWERAGFFFDAKIGKTEDGMGGTRPVSKYVSVIYDKNDLTPIDYCLGLDLEVAVSPATTPATKTCFKIRPKVIIEHTAI
jgi:hypothetical protein